MRKKKLRLVSVYLAQARTCGRVPHYLTLDNQLTLYTQTLNDNINRQLFINRNGFSVRSFKMIDMLQQLNRFRNSKPINSYLIEKEVLRIGLKINLNTECVAGQI